MSNKHHARVIDTIHTIHKICKLTHTLYTCVAFDSKIQSEKKNNMHLKLQISLPFQNIFNIGTYWRATHSHNNKNNKMNLN